MTASTVRSATRPIFVVTILTGSFLLFLVQPMVARMALPRLGGAPAVWNSAMLVYQALLLAGYAYAHALGRLRPRMQAGVHVAVLLVAALWLPIGLSVAVPPVGTQPALWVPWLLALSIGPLFFAVSAQAPLLQRWFSLSSAGSDPYALYAASNFGSFAGLIAYPLFVEPRMAIHAQSLLWSCGYALLVVFVLVCATRLPRAIVATAAGKRTGAMPTTSAPPSRARVGRWVLTALVPSGLMLATSTYITTDIVAMPLLWVLPLGLYLLSFTIAFAQNRKLADLLTRIAPLAILLFGGVMIVGYQTRPFLNAGIALALLFIVSVALHTALYGTRPAADRLTGFYLAMSLGGVLGGLFAALIAPVVFDWTYEYPLMILAAGLLVPQGFLVQRTRALWTGDHARAAFGAIVLTLAILFVSRLIGPSAIFGQDRQGLAFLVIALAGIATIGRRDAYAVLLAGTLILFGGYQSIALSLKGDARTRSYFGVYTVRDGRTPDGRGMRQLDHGTTVHGIQLTGTLQRERTPTTYYARGSGIGQAMLALPALYGPRARVGVVGLGTGTLACYATPAQRWRFYEIDPAIVRIARDSGKFTYLRDCLPHPLIRLGDARVTLSQEPDAMFDLLALDAFSSDAVPMHLMTAEAFGIYARVLAPRGLLLVHVSNRFLDLEPVVAAAAKQGGWTAAVLHYRPSAIDRAKLPSASVWIALSHDPHAIALLNHRDAAWTPLAARPGFIGWTDDYSTILPLLKGLP